MPPGCPSIPPKYVILAGILKLPNVVLPPKELTVSCATRVELVSLGSL
jgi:hypothetical protein